MTEINLTTKRLWPTSIAAAMLILDATLSDKDKQKIKGLPRKNLYRLYQGLGKLICDGFGLDNGNDELITETFETDPSLAMKTLISCYWEHLNIAG
ncbi:MAG: hypothetical protein IPI97_14445 [Nitrosomonas sp.]|nr:hypothetical protein [Nitrosomonas sp.]